MPPKKESKEPSAQHWIKGNAKPREIFGLLFIAGIMTAFLVKASIFLYGFYVFSSILFVIINLTNSKKYYKNISILLSRLLLLFSILIACSLTPEWAIGWSGNNVGLYSLVTTFLIDIEFYQYCIFISGLSLVTGFFSCVVVAIFFWNYFLISMARDIVKKELSMLSIAIISFVLVIASAKEMSSLAGVALYDFNSRGSISVPFSLSVLSSYISTCFCQSFCTILGVNHDLHESTKQ